MPSRNVRARPISWRISQDKRVNDLADPWAMLAYTWMIPSADNKGRMEGDPDLLASMLFPRQRNKITPERMDVILKQLHDNGLAFLYQVNGEWYLQFPKSSWNKHQKIVGNMKDESDFPEPPEKEYQEWLEITRVYTSIYEYKRVPNEGKGREEEEKRREEILDDDDNNAREEEKELKPEKEKNLVSIFENEFARPLSPMEISQIVTWQEEHPVSLVVEGLRVAVMRGVVNCKYIDSTLHNWEKANIRTVQEARIDQEKRREKQPQKLANKASLDPETEAYLQEMDEKERRIKLERQNTTSEHGSRDSGTGLHVIGGGAGSSRTTKPP